jgi:AmmeMemoRadiSam system protein B
LELSIIVDADTKLRNTFKLASWLFIKLLGVIFLIAFVSLFSQILGLAGSEGILPATDKLSEYKNQYGALAPIWRPSLLWLCSNNVCLQSLALLGAGASIALVSGVLPGISLFLCWLIYLSLKNVVVYFLGFQWDDMLLECGFITLFITSWSVIDPVITKKKTLDHPFALLCLRWMLFRVMFCSGVVKLIGGCSLWLDFSALAHYWETQLLPNEFAWHLFAMPKWFQTIGVAVTFLLELIFPFFVFAKRRLRIAAAIALIILQLAMLCTGNHGFINLLTAALCVPLLDDQCLKKIFPKIIADRLLSTEVMPEANSKKKDRFAKAAAVCFLAITLLSMVATFLPKSAFAHYTRPVLDVFARGYHLTGQYGLYPVVNTERLELIVEGSNDGQSWQPYTFKYHIGALDRPPPAVFLQQPRLDWRMRFAALGSAALNSWVNSFVQKLLQGSEPVLSLLDKNPFSTQPPKYIRVQLYNYQFTTEHERQTTGNWWRRQFVSNYLPATALKEPGVRSMAFAGSWYPEDPTTLQKLFEDLEKRAKLRTPTNFGLTNETTQLAYNSSALSALLIPHAAYRYSGVAAMEAYLKAKQNGPRNLKRIILIGPLHKMYGLNLKGALLPSDAAFATPFGKLPLDTEAIHELSKAPNFSVNESAHDVEHSIEMQLPLVHYIFKNIAIVPVLITNGNDQNSLKSIASGLRSILKDGDLIITSGDMTHWGKMYDYEPFSENVISNVQKLDQEGFSFIANRDSDGFAQFQYRTKEDMCCFEPVSVLLNLLPTNSKAYAIDYYTSQDAMPKPLGSEAERCVGYLSVSFSDGREQEEKPAKMR